MDPIIITFLRILSYKFSDKSKIDISVPVIMHRNFLKFFLYNNVQHSLRDSYEIIRGKSTFLSHLHS